MKTQAEIEAKFDELVQVIDGDFGGSSDEVASIEGWISALEWVLS